MQKIADRLGISKVSVSKALNNQPSVSDSLRVKVIQTAEEMGYTLQKIQRTKKTYSFAFIVPKRFFLDNEKFYSTIYYYLNKESQKSGYQLMTFVITKSEEESCQIPEPLKLGEFNGAFVVGECHNEYLMQLRAVDIPIVMIDFYLPSLQMDCVLSDNFYNGFVVTNYLIKRGHEQIGFAGSSQYTSSIADRFFGYQKALYINNLEMDKQMVFPINDVGTGVYTLNFELPDKLPTAFVCHCDMAAYYLIQKLQIVGISVPEDISVISFDNTELSQICDPALTSMDISKSGFACEALSVMIERLTNPKMQIQRRYIQATLVKRSSVRDLTIV